jgi:hypothetical protein
MGLFPPLGGAGTRLSCFPRRAKGFHSYQEQYREWPERSLGSSLSRKHTLSVGVEFTLYRLMMSEMREFVGIDNSNGRLIMFSGQCPASSSSLL